MDRLSSHKRTRVRIDTNRTRIHRFRLYTLPRIAITNWIPIKHPVFGALLKVHYLCKVCWKPPKPQNIWGRKRIEIHILRHSNNQFKIWTFFQWTQVLLQLYAWQNTKCTSNPSSSIKNMFNSDHFSISFSKRHNTTYIQLLSWSNYRSKANHLKRPDLPDANEC